MTVDMRSHVNLVCTNKTFISRLSNSLEDDTDNTQQATENVHEPEDLDGDDEAKGDENAEVDGGDAMERVKWMRCRERTCQRG